MNELVQRLTEGKHPVVLGGSQISLEEFQRRVKDLGYVFIKFPETRGGTDLGVKVDESMTDLSQANFGQGAGLAHIEGTLVLDYSRVRCIADIDLATLTGSGKLVFIEEVGL
jgi:hypothetical protein